MQTFWGCIFPRSHKRKQLKKKFCLEFTSEREVCTWNKLSPELSLFKLGDEDLGGSLYYSPCFYMSLKQSIHTHIQHTYLCIRYFLYIHFYLSYKKASLMATHLLSKQVVNPSTYHKHKCLLFCLLFWTYAWTCFSKNWFYVLWTDYGFDMVHAIPLWWCQPDQLAETHFIHKVIWVPWSVLTNQSRNVYFSHEWNIFYLCRGYKSELILTFSDQKQKYLFQTKWPMIYIYVI